MSPPIWETYVNSVSEAVAKSSGAAAKAAAVAATPSAAPPEAGFELKGVISAASSNQVAELNAYAAARTEVVIDSEDLLIMKESDVFGVVEEGLAKKKAA